MYKDFAVDVREKRMYVERTSSVIGRSIRSDIGVLVIPQLGV